MRVQAQEKLAGREVDVIDIGCGDRPYEAVVAPYARSYVGVDIYEAPTVDVVCPAESLPFDDASFDCVLCTQVLEHALDPHAVCHEVNRVLRPDGVAFVSTHGVIPYHSAPYDFWRWTHSGLERLLTTTGDWSDLDVYANGGTGTALAYLMGRELETAVPRAGKAARAAVLALNAIGWNLDRSARRDPSAGPPNLAANYLAVATR